jgi:hypothetical protein
MAVMLPMDKTRGVKAMESENNTNISQMNSCKKEIVYSESFLYDALYPVLVAMRCFGLYHTRHDKQCPIRVLSQVYSLAIGAMILSTLIRISLQFKHVDSFGLELFSSLVYIIWLFWCFCSFVSCFRAWANDSKAPAYFISFEQVLMSCELHHKCFRSVLRRRAWIFTLMASSFVALNTGIACYFLFEVDVVMNHMKTPIELFNTFPRWGQILTNVILALGLTFISAAWVFPNAFVHCIAYALRLELKSFNEALSAAIDKNGHFQGDIHQYRVRHQVVARLIEQADDLLGFQVSVNLFCPMALLIFLLYEILWDPAVGTEALVLLSYIYWIVTSSSFTGMVFYDGASINDAVSIFGSTL